MSVKKKNMLQRLMALAVLMATLLCMPVAAMAADAKKGSVTLTYPVDGVEFQLHYVGKYEKGEYVLDSSLDYDVDLEENGAAATLIRYLKRDKVQPMKTGTVENGKLVLNNLPLGVYVLIGEEAEDEDYVYTPNPMMFSIPQNKNNKPEWDVTITGKYEREPIPPEEEYVDISVRKIWNDDGHKSKRPEEIKVQLLCDDEVYDTVTLNRSNNWRCTWTDLDADCEWDVVEKKVPDNYKVSIKQKGNTFIVTNTYKNPPPYYPPGKLPQTGQLWWPVPILAFAGLAFVAIGTVCRRKNENET